MFNEKEIQTLKQLLENEIGIYRNLVSPFDPLDAYNLNKEHYVDMINYLNSLLVKVSTTSKNS